MEPQEISSFLAHMAAGIDGRRGPVSRRRVDRDLRIVLASLTAAAKDVVTEAFSDQPERLKKLLSHNRSKDITWIAKRLGEGVDPDELYEAVEELFQQGDFLDLPKRKPAGYAGWEDLLDGLEEARRNRGARSREMSDEEIVQAIPEELREAVAKAYAWKPKTRSDGWDDDRILDAIEGGEKPVGEVRIKRVGELASRGIEHFPMKNNPDRIYVFQPENEDLAQLVAAYYQMPGTEVPADVSEVLIGLGFGYPIGLTLENAGLESEPGWLKSIVGRS